MPVVPHLLDIHRAKAFLRVGKACAHRMLFAEQVRQERLHATPCKKRSRIVFWNKRGPWNYCVSPSLKKIQIFRADFVNGHYLVKYNAMAKKAKHKKEKNWWGFDTGSINKNKRPQDDFYAYANVGWLKSAAIPPEEARWGSFNILRYETELRLKKIAARTRDPLVGQIYRSAIDLKHHNKLGLKPLRPLLGHVRAAKNKEELLKTLAHFHRIGVSGFWGTFVDQDAKQSSRYILHLWQGGLGMPDRDYYLLDGREQRRGRDAYVLHIKKLMRIAGTSKKGAERFVKTVMVIETALARGSMCKEDLRDAEKVYHKKSAHELARISPEIDWQKFFALIGVRKTKKIIVGQPKFFAAVSKIIEATPLEDLKIYLEWNLINGCAPLLSEPLVRENFNFYARTLAGVKKMRQPWRRALGAVGGCVPFALGELYVKRYFPHSAKRAIDALVDDLFLAYETRIKKLDWMSIVTKRKAVKKLRSMARKIGYPSKRKSYKGLVAKEKDFFGNMLRASEFEHRRQIKKLLQPIDRAEWHMKKSFSF